MTTSSASWNDIRDVMMRLIQSQIDIDFPRYKGAICVTDGTDGVIRKSTDDFCIRGITHQDDFVKFMTEATAEIRKITESPEFNGYKVLCVTALNILSEQSNPDGGTMFFRVIGYNDKAPIKVAA